MPDFFTFGFLHQPERDVVEMPGNCCHQLIAERVALFAMEFDHLLVTSSNRNFEVVDDHQLEHTEISAERGKGYQIKTPTKEPEVSNDDEEVWHNQQFAEFLYVVRMEN